MPEPSPMLPPTNTSVILNADSPTGTTATPTVVIDDDEWIEETPTHTVIPTHAPTATPTLIAVLLPIIQNAPTPTSIPPTSVEESTTSKIVIIKIFYNGVNGNKEPDEYVEIQNDGSGPTNLNGGILHDEDNKHRFKFPNYIIEPGAVCRIYTNESHPEWCGFNFGESGSAIWNNDGDCAYLYDIQGNLVHQKCY
jgi:hypothetical protein